MLCKKKKRKKKKKEKKRKKKEGAIFQATHYQLRLNRVGSNPFWIMLLLKFPFITKDFKNCQQIHSYIYTHTHYIYSMFVLLKKIYIYNEKYIHIIIWIQNKSMCQVQNT